MASAGKVTKPAQKSTLSSLGLEGVPNLNGLMAAKPSEAKTGRPLDLPMDLIDEDPNQPRTADNPGFSPESIAELAATIKPRGVKSPISVRDNQEQPGRYIINHGARRFRASRVAERTTIPGFVDNDYLEADQVIENLQRNELTAREIADYIGRRLSAGSKKGDIAKELGKSPAFVTQHVTLLDLPESIAEAFNIGRVKDVTVINELVTAHKKKPQEVADWLADDTQEITRGTVKLLREFLDDEGRDPDTIDAFSGKTDSEAGNDEQGPGGEGDSKESKEADASKLKKAIVQVQFDSRPARIILNKRPTEVGLAWFKYEDDGEEFEADIGSATLVALVEG